MSVKTERHYIWSKQGQALVMVNDIKWLYKNPEFDPDEDKIYELGPEVKIEVNIKVIPTKPVYRGRGMKIITTKPVYRGHEGANH